MSAILKLDSSDYDKKLKGAGNDAKTIGQKISSALGTAASVTGKTLGTLGKAAVRVTGAAVKTAGVLLAGAATAVTKLATDSAKAFAEYEQLAGGAQLLFGDAYETVAKNAAQAYRTVQMSQTEYLNQVNGFAVGLKTALGGDAEAAAQLAHQILTAEADIVAATGRDAEAVQNAFNGIMRGNFMMLDNLGLGIAGTKEGMKQVVDAVNEHNKAIGDAKRYTMDNVADMQAALVKYVELQGLSGYASREASTTIQGALASLKASWSDLITGLSNKDADIGALIGNMLSSATGFIKNIIPVATQALSGIAMAVGELAPFIADRLPGLINDVLPSVITAAKAILGGLIKAAPTILSGLLSLAPEIIKLGGQLIKFLVTAITDNLPLILEIGTEALLELVNGLTDPSSLSALITAAITAITTLVEALASGDAITQLIGGAMTIIMALCDGLIQNLPMILTAALDMILELAMGITQALPELIPALIDVVLTIVNTLTQPDMIGMLIDAALALIMALADGILEALPVLIDAIPGIIDNLALAIGENLPKILTMGIELIIKLALGIVQAIPQLLAVIPQVILSLLNGLANGALSLINSGKKMVENVKSGFMEKLSNAKQWGKDLIQNFLSGITAKWEALKNTVRNVANTVKSFLGFSEPEEGPLSDFHTYAPDMMNLFIKGVKDNERKLRLAVADAFDVNDLMPDSAMELRTDSSASNGTIINGGIEIRIDGAQYSDEQELARAVARELQVMTNRRAAVYA